MAVGSGVELVRTRIFVRDGVAYQFEGGSDFAKLVSPGPTRYEVYDVRDTSGKAIYIGITGGKEIPRDALDRLLEHLKTKNGEFIGDAASIHVRGRDLDEKLARALEDDLISTHQPRYNNRERDRYNYQRTYGDGPKMSRMPTTPT